MNKIRIVIADDHPIFSRGLRQILMADPGLDVVAELVVGGVLPQPKGVGGGNPLGGFDLAADVGERGG